MSEQWACNRCNTSAGQNMAACPNCGLLRGAEAPAAGQTLVAGGADSGVPAPGTVAHSWSERVGPLLRWLTVGLWFALALAGLAIALEAPRYTPAFVIAFLLAPPVAVGLACLFIRGRGIAAGIALLSVAVIGIGATFFLGVLAQLDEQPDTLANYAWVYLFFGAAGALLLRGIWSLIDALVHARERELTIPWWLSFPWSLFG